MAIFSMISRQMPTLGKTDKFVEGVVGLREIVQNRRGDIFGHGLSFCAV